MSQVVIGDILPRTQAVASGGQTVFGTNWTANYASDVVVYSRADGVDADDATQQVPYPSGYSVAFIGAEQEVQVTLVTPSTLGDIVTITRQTPAERMNLYTNSNFLPSMLNNDFGILTLVDQQAQLVNQLIGPRYNYSAIIIDEVDTILPILGPNQFWTKNSDDTAIIAVDAAEIVGGVTEIDTGTGLTGGPITSTGTISFAPMAANTLWANITGASAVPTEVPTGYFLITSNNLSDVPNKATARSNLGLAIGTDVEAWSAALDSIASLTTSANQMIYTTASNTYAALSASANSTLVTSAGSVPSFSQTLPSAVQSNITRLGAQAIALNMNSHQINNVTDPTNPQDAATMAYVTAQTSGLYLPLTGGTMSGLISMGNNKITNLTNPSASQDAVTLSYLNTAIADYLPLSGGTMTGVINMGSHKITALTDPTNPQDAATKNYVDTVATGLTIQPAVYAASTTALTVTYANGASGIGATLTNAGVQATFALDGTNPAVNDRVLIWNQASALQNGIYTVTNVGSGASNWILTRATDYDQPAEIQPGDLVIVNNGTTYAGTSFIETASVAAVGTDSISFSQFTFSATAVLLKANNLSDVANTTTAFNNISPMTTKGDLIGYSTQNVRLAVGVTNGQILQVSSGAATGLAWSTAAYPATTTINQILYSSAANTVVGLSTVNGSVLVTDASGVPQFLANPGVAGKILQSANAAIPAWSTPTYPSASGTSGQFMISDGTNNVYSTSTIPTSAGSTANKVLLSDGTNYVLSTPTFPNASATSRKIIVSDGTNWIPSTETYAIPGTSGNVLTSNGTNWTSAPPVGTGTVNSGTINQLAWYAATGTVVSGLSTGNNGVLVTNGTGVPSISTTLPTGLTIPGYAVVGANGDITSMTGLTQYLQAPLGVKGSNSQIVVTFSDNSASAVNYIALGNNITGNSPAVQALGSDANIILDLKGKGTGGAQVLGTSTNNNAPAGYVGEYVSSQIPLASATSLTTGTPKNITSISLTAGDWDVSGNIFFLASGGTGFFGAAVAAISTTSATNPDNSLISSIGGAATLISNIGLSVFTQRLSLSGSATVYLVATAASYGAGTGVTGCGFIGARRVR